MSAAFTDLSVPSSQRSLREMQTLRLRLSVPRPEDFADLCVLWSDEDVTRFIGGRAQSPEEVWSRLLRYIGHWSVLGYGYWIIRETVTGRFVGELGFAEMRRPIPAPFSEFPEAGWAVMPWTRGMGFASEALAAAVLFADARFLENQTVCMIDPQNTRSQRLALRHGYARYGDHDYRGVRLDLFARTRGAPAITIS
jgi:RimJ/RimL family protein N-acetyltransferase